MTNAEIADVFSFLSKLSDIHGENSFKVKSYSIASFTIDKLSQSLWEMDMQEMAAIKGIGESCAKKIIELLQTGTIQSLNELLLKTPEGILELMKIKGIGPKKIQTIWKELQIETPGELLYACNENRLIHFKGFGEKTQQSIKESLEFYFSNQGYLLYAQAIALIEKLSIFFQNKFPEIRFYTCGEYAMQCDIITKLQWVVVLEMNILKSTLQLYEEWVLQNETDDSLLYKYSGVIDIQFFITQKENLVFTLMEKSSSDDFFQSFSQKYPVINSLKNIEDELHIWQQSVGYSIPPYCRSGNLKIDDISLQKIKNVIQSIDIKGAIHNHSTWSDGANTIEEMALACIELGYEYLVMSDHSVSSFYANGLQVERIYKQHAEIDFLNSKLAPFKIYKSIECDILNDGSLDYEDEVLQSFDLVIASVHQNLRMSQEKAMERLLKAIANPFTTILGHMTGRLLLSRKGYPIQHELIIDACKQHNVVIELNANPRRLDMDYTWIPYALQHGVMMSINPDAHNTKGLLDIHYGVLSAQKSLLPTSSNLSSFTKDEFDKFLAAKKNK